MLLSAVCALVVAQSSSEIPEGLTNNPVYKRATFNSCCSWLSENLGHLRSFQIPTSIVLSCPFIMHFTVQIFITLRIKSVFSLSLKNYTK